MDGDRNAYLDTVLIGGREPASMGLTDKAKNAAQDAKGKEAAGKTTVDHRLEAEGKADQTKASLKQAGEHVKDALSD